MPGPASNSALELVAQVQLEQVLALPWRQALELALRPRAVHAQPLRGHPQPFARPPVQGRGPGVAALGGAEVRLLADAEAVVAQRRPPLAPLPGSEQED